MHLTYGFFSFFFSFKMSKNIIFFCYLLLVLCITFFNFQSIENYILIQNIIILILVFYFLSFYKKTKIFIDYKILVHFILAYLLSQFFLAILMLNEIYFFNLLPNIVYETAGYLNIKSLKGMIAVPFFYFLLIKRNNFISFLLFF